MNTKKLFKNEDDRRSFFRRHKMNKIESYFITKAQAERRDAAILKEEQQIDEIYQAEETERLKVEQASQEIIKEFDIEILKEELEEDEEMAVLKDIWREENGAIENQEICEAEVKGESEAYRQHEEDAEMEILEEIIDEDTEYDEEQIILQKERNKKFYGRVTYGNNGGLVLSEEEKEDLEFKRKLVQYKKDLQYYVKESGNVESTPPPPSEAEISCSVPSSSSSSESVSSEEPSNDLLSRYAISEGREQEALSAHGDTNFDENEEINSKSSRITWDINKGFVANFHGRLEKRRELEENAQGAKIDDEIAYDIFKQEEKGIIIKFKLMNIIDDEENEIINEVLDEEGDGSDDGPQVDDHEFRLKEHKRMYAKAFSEHAESHDGFDDYRNEFHEQHFHRITSYLGRIEHGPTKNHWGLKQECVTCGKGNAFCTFGRNRKTICADCMIDFCKLVKEADALVGF